MLQLIELVGEIIYANQVSVTGDISIGEPLVLTGNVEIAKGGSTYPYYEGEYLIIPKVYEQILDTDHKILTDDVDVQGITFIQVPNEKGGITTTIGEV